MLNVISIGILILTIVLTLLNTKYGFCIFILVRILVPETFRVSFVDLSLNTCIILILLFLIIIKNCIQSSNLVFNKKILIAILLFCVYTVSSLVLSQYGNLSYQLIYFFQFVLTDLVPFVIGIIILRNKEDLNIIIRTIIIACIICTSYGIITYFSISNPYIALFSNNGNSILNEQWYGNYTTSTFISTNSFGYYIGLTFPFMFFLFKKNIYIKETKFCLVLLFICSILCKKRTTILCVCLYLIMILFNRNPKKMLKYLFVSCFVICISVVIIFSVPSLESVKDVIITSLFFWNDSMYNTVTLGNGGSSMALRINQLLYPLEEINQNVIFGHGFGWCSWFLSQGRIHPILFGFESLPSQVICEYGLMSFFIVPMVFISLFKFASNGRKEKYTLFFVILSIVQMLGTGMVYMYLELIYLLLIKKINQIIY